MLQETQPLETPAGTTHQSPLPPGTTTALERINVR